MKRDAFALSPPEVREIRHFHLFCGLGGGAKGFNRASPRVGNLVGKFRCLGGIDVSAPAIRDFERLTGARGTVLDLFDRSQFLDFHGVEPPASWREAGPADIRAASAAPSAPPQDQEAELFERQASKKTGGRRGGPVFEKACAAIAEVRHD